MMSAVMLAPDTGVSLLYQQYIFETSRTWYVVGDESFSEHKLGGTKQSRKHEMRRS